MSADPRLVPMDLFLQDQKRQDDEMVRMSDRTSRSVDNVVSELRGMRRDNTRQTAVLENELQKQTVAAAIVADRKLEEEKQAFTRREKVIASLAIGVPVIITFVLRVFDSLS